MLYTRLWVPTFSLFVLLTSLHLHAFVLRIAHFCATHSTFFIDMKFTYRKDFTPEIHKYDFDVLLACDK